MSFPRRNRRMPRKFMAMPHPEGMIMKRMPGSLAAKSVFNPIRQQELMSPKMYTGPSLPWDTNREQIMHIRHDAIERQVIINLPSTILLVLRFSPCSDASTSVKRQAANPLIAVERGADVTESLPSS